MNNQDSSSHIDTKMDILIENVSKLMVLANTINARLDILEKMLTSNNVQSKRTIKTINSSKTQENNDELIDNNEDIAQSSNNTGNTVTILNNLVFFKVICMYLDTDNTREKYKDLIDKFTKEMETAKGKKKKVDTFDYWISIANSIWKTFSDVTKSEYSVKFKEWKSNNSSNQVEINKKN